MFCGDFRKRFHCFNNQILIDFDGKIIAASINHPGSWHDVHCYKFKIYFDNILEQDNSLALGDPGYKGLPRVVAGLRANEIVTPEQKRFVLVSKAEQKKIEGTNNYYKKQVKSLSKETRFRMKYSTLGSITIISLGLYNWKLELGYFSDYFENDDAINRAWSEDLSKFKYPKEKDETSEEENDFSDNDEN